jgi:cell surface protein SprA
MRNVYRVGSSDVDRNSIGLDIRVNGSSSPLDGRGTYLGRLGLALQNDATTLDVYNRVFPRTRDPNGGAPIKDLFVVFPNLRPFADSANLQPAEQNDSLYQTPEYLLSTQGPPPTFRLGFNYQEVGAGDRSTLNLGAIQIRDGSEKIFIGNTQLVRGQDYTINYDVGVVTSTARHRSRRSSSRTRSSIRRRGICWASRRRTTSAPSARSTRSGCGSMRVVRRHARPWASSRRPTSSAASARSCSSSRTASPGP